MPNSLFRMACQRNGIWSRRPPASHSYRRVTKSLLTAAILATGPWTTSRYLVVISVWGSVPLPALGLLSPHKQEDSRSPPPAFRAHRVARRTQAPRSWPQEAALAATRGASSQDRRAFSRGCPCLPAFRSVPLV